MPCTAHRLHEELLWSHANNGLKFYWSHVLKLSNLPKIFLSGSANYSTVCVWGGGAWFVRVWCECVADSCSTKM